MSACKTLVRISISCLECGVQSNNRRTFSSLSLRRLRPISNYSYSPQLSFSPFLSPNRGYGIEPYGASSRPYGCIEGAVSLDTADCTDETVSQNLTLEPPEDLCKDTVEELLLRNDDVSRFMKMERRPEVLSAGQFAQHNNRWFPYLDEFKAGSALLRSDEVLEALDPYIMEVRKERFKNVVKNRSYSVCLVVEGLADFGNVSATFRSADALGIQSVHVVSCDSSKRCNKF